jgi:hypothetical protein
MNNYTHKPDNLIRGDKSLFCLSTGLYMTQGTSVILGLLGLSGHASLVKNSMITIQPLSSTNSGEPCHNKEQRTINHLALPKHTDK